MATQKPQNFQNHGRIVPLYHRFALPVFFINLGWTFYRLVRFGASFETVFEVLMSLALLILFFYARIFALTVQDRVIRLEMRLRLAEVLPAELRPSIPEFSVGQLVAMRFASDAELPGLAQKVLAEKLSDRKTIKRLIRDWQADYLRV